MSSAIQSTLTGLEQNDYVFLAMLSAVGYDYVLTFPDEIEYIWTQPWSCVSILFALVRYAGLCSLAIPGLIETTFLRSSEKDRCQGKMMFTIDLWMFLLFVGAADYVMILRVWAMYSQSRVILGLLLVLFSLEIIPTCVAAAIRSDPSYLSVSIIHVLNWTSCPQIASSSSVSWMTVVSTLQMTHGAVLCTLAVAQFVKQSLQMYRVTKQWQVNRYMNLLIKQGVIYFIAYVLFLALVRMFMPVLVNVLRASSEMPNEGWTMVLLVVLGSVPMYTLTPRFIISIRALHAHDIQGRCGSGIDTGFGLSSGCPAARSAIVFANVDDEQNKEVSEGIPMEGRMG